MNIHKANLQRITERSTTHELHLDTFNDTLLLNAQKRGGGGGKIVNSTLLTGLHFGKLPYRHTSPCLRIKNNPLEQNTRGTVASEKVAFIANETKSQSLIVVTHKLSFSNTRKKQFE